MKDKNVEPLELCLRGGKLTSLRSDWIHLVYQSADSKANLQNIQDTIDVMELLQNGDFDCAKAKLNGMRDDTLNRYSSVLMFVTKFSPKGVEFFRSVMPGELPRNIEAWLEDLADRNANYDAAQSSIGELLATLPGNGQRLPWDNNVREYIAKGKGLIKEENQQEWEKRVLLSAADERDCCMSIKNACDVMEILHRQGPSDRDKMVKAAEELAKESHGLSDYVTAKTLSTVEVFCGQIGLNFAAHYENTMSSRDQTGKYISHNVLKF